MKLAALIVVSLCAGCGPRADHKPTGTTNDPVAVCERVADVCKIDSAKLGVCTQRRGDAGLICVSQH